MADSEKLTGRLWSAIEHIYDGVLSHPFVSGLTDGTLPAESFRHYIEQDTHYLRGYARALSVCAAKAPTERDTVMFAEHAAGAIAAEQDMHAELMAELGAPFDQDAPVAPTTQAYSSYLLATVYGGSFAEGVGAVLPCYWIYARVGEELLTRSSPNPLYARWIAMYGGEEFQKVVDDVLALTDRIGTTLSETETRRVVDHFVTTSRYEWMFWDAAFRREVWPI
ncbi:thiaminase II [Pseudonocardia spinosispora]|uniref:thiaminase II n=1 Tax=Pseudonocardia spinosispora TaxID=103441 RepID=UPI00041DCD94|nr:thiaminase II [Pseudonocardia spinosispora]